MTNLAELVNAQAATRPDAVALVQPGLQRRTLTWAELEGAVAAVASGLASYGLVAGQRVALCAPNGLEFVVAYFAALRAGFVCVPVNPACTEVELVTVLRDSGARLLLAVDRGSVPGVTTLPLTGAGLEALAARAAAPVSSPADREALAVLLYTAGTSGEPKAAMLTHRALLSHLEHFAGYGVLTEETVVLVAMPLFHVFGLNAVLGAGVLAGATAVVTGVVDDLVRTVVEERVTHLPVAPWMLYRLLEHEDLGDSLALVRNVVSGAAPLPPSLEAEFTRRTGLRVEQGYGLTEASPGVTVTLGSDTTGPGLVGRPLPGVQVRIGNGQDETEPGEIWVRGDNLFSGYWPDGHGGPGPDGWFATGDVGYLVDGELFLVDRARDLVLVHGFHVYPAEIENVIRQLPGVQEVAVIGRPEPQAGERVVAFVVGEGLTADAVVEHCGERLARFKQPSEVHVLASLPRGATGKVKKGALRRLSPDPPPEPATSGGRR